MQHPAHARGIQQRERWVPANEVVHLGERSGKLENMLQPAASAFDRQVAISLKLFTTAFPPLLIIVMAGVGGFVLAAILLPLLQMQSLVA